MSLQSPSGSTKAQTKNGRICSPLTAKRLSGSNASDVLGQAIDSVANATALRW